MINPGNYYLMKRPDKVKNTIFRKKKKNMKRNLLISDQKNQNGMGKDQLAFIKTKALNFREEIQNKVKNQEQTVLPLTEQIQNQKTKRTKKVVKNKQNNNK